MSFVDNMNFVALFTCLEIIILKLKTTKVQYKLYFINDLTHIRVFPYRPAYHIFEPASRRIHDPVHLVRHC